MTAAILDNSDKVFAFTCTPNQDGHAGYKYDIYIRLIIESSSVNVFLYDSIEIVTGKQGEFNIGARFARAVEHNLVCRTPYSKSLFNLLDRKILFDFVCKT